MVDEYVVLTDSQNNPTGTALKATVHSDKTPVHRAFSCFLFNSKGELLLQQRALTKKTWPGIWSNSCCGHPAPGEVTEDSVYRRLSFELGVPRSAVRNLQVILPNFKYYVEREGVVEREFCPVYAGRLDCEPTINPLEVHATRWIPWNEYTGVAAALLPHLTSVPTGATSFDAYRNRFSSAQTYKAAHALPGGEPLSEWSLWETNLLLKNESFNTLFRTL